MKFLNALSWRKDHDHLPALKFWFGFDLGNLVGFRLDALQQLHTQLLMSHFTPPEPQGDLDLVALVEKAPHVAHLHIIVVGIDIRAHLDFLHIEGLLLLARFVGFFLGLVFELAKIKQLANRRFGITGNLDEIKTSLIGQCPCSFYRDRAVVFTFGVNELDFVGFDVLVGLRARLGGRCSCPEWSAWNVSLSLYCLCSENDLRNGLRQSNPSIMRT